MTATVMNHTVRRLLVVGSGTAGVLLAGVLASHPAAAETPEGFPPPPSVDFGFVLGVLVGIPVLLFVLIGLATYLPALVRGERVAPGATGAEDQWLGGRRDAAALAAAPSPGDPTTAEAQAGGASARW